MKRLMEVLVAGLGLVVLSPLLALVAAAIKLDSPGPVFFRQRRLGRSRAPFEVVKFRTMTHREHINQHAEQVVAGNADTRITRVGRLLRVSSIDELPQLINVLKGDMSLVGPRPILPEQLEVVPEDRMARFGVRPGITGLAQVQGRRSLDWMDQLAYDVEYANAPGIGRDLAILLRTVAVVLTGSGIYGDASKNWRAYREPTSEAEASPETAAGPRMNLMFITNDPALAAYAVASGADRLFVDLETLGKQERQGHLDTHQAAHTPEDVAVLRQAIPEAEIMARVNPLHRGSAAEVDAVIRGGADYVMLPMFTTALEVGCFLDLVAGRAGSTLLLETPQALTRIDEVLAHRARIDEIHVGLNDLHLGMGLDFMFELLSGGLVGYLAEKVRSASVRFGFGGIARVGEGAVPAELVMGEHVRLGSEMAILSRTFHQRAASVADLREKLDLVEEIRKVRECEAAFQLASPEELESNRLRLQEAVNGVVRRRTAAAASAAV